LQSGMIVHQEPLIEPLIYWSLHRAFIEPS